MFPKDYNLTSLDLGVWSESGVVDKQESVHEGERLVGKDTESLSYVTTCGGSPERF